MPISPTSKAVVGHEYFHNWTGNRVTCRDWFQLSLKEGLTVFRDQEFSRTWRRSSARAVKRIEDVRVLRTAQFPEDAGPMAHPVRPDSYVEINNFYTVTIYEKGAEVVRMMQTLVGREVSAGMALYFERHDGQAVTCDDFAQAIADANPGSPLAACCRSSSAGTARPARRASGKRRRYDAARRAPTRSRCRKAARHAGPADQGSPSSFPWPGPAGADGSDLPCNGGRGRPSGRARAHWC
jgi:aminopeptidase N